MKRTNLLLIFIISAVISVNAQAPDGLQFGAGIRLGVPTGGFENTHSFGVGIEAQAEYGFEKNVSGIATTGYTTFFGKDFTVSGVTIKSKTVGYIPILAGIRFYPANKVFIGAQVGYGILTGNGNSTGAFNYQTQIGYNGDKFQLAASYNALSKNSATTAHIGLTGIYKFGDGGRE